MLMSIYNLAALLLTFTTIGAADSSNYFTNPEDASNDPTNNDPSQNPIFTLGTTQVITWVTNATAVQLTLVQYGRDGGPDDVLCNPCTGGSYTWNGQVTQDLDYGNVFSLFFGGADNPDSGNNSTSQYFNITGSASKPTVTPFLPPDTSSPVPAPPSSVSPPSTDGKTTSSTPPPTSPTPSPQVSKATSSTSTASIPPPESPTSINTAPTEPGAVLPTRTTDSSPTSTLKSASTSLPAVQNNQSNTSSSSLKIGAGIGGGVFSAAVLIAGLFFFLRRRKSQKPVRAQSPPPWSPGTDAAVPEAKGPPQRYDRVEMEVPNSPSVKSPIPGAVPGNGGFSKAELPPETCEKGLDEGGGSKRVEEFIGVELP